ncbi:MAG: bifunctional DedA family/phosphatase PAP2 family protein [Acidobacteria bacterium]|nr:bifunctional DedA family/phosphatase PAP2 family protein [Acidobacteriota bacterium]
MKHLVAILLGLHGAAAYTLVFALATLEASAFLGLVVPGETAVLLGGVLAFQHKVSFTVVALAAVAGAVLGDSIGYFIGSRFGARLLDTRLGRRIGADRLQRARDYVRRKGAAAIVLGRFTTVLRVLVPSFAGMAGMPYGRFLAANVAGGIAWGLTFTAVGYLAGTAWQRVERQLGRASLILLFLLVLGLAIYGTARWAARHPDRLRALGNRFTGLGPVAWAGRRLRGPVAFAARRFDPRAATGLRLTAGLSLLGLGGWVFGVILADVIARNDVAAFDLPLARAIARNVASAPWLATAMRAATTLGGGAVVGAAAVVVIAAWRLFRKTWEAGWLLAISLAGATVIEEVVKDLVHRPRPPVLRLAHASGWSFPSGHATRAAVFYGTLAILAGRLWPAWTARVRAWACAAGVVVLVAASRLILGVHYLTDVLGGMALGGAWLAVVATALPPPRGARAPGSPR